MPRDTTRIAPIVVSATRVALNTNTLPVAVTVITAAQLRLRGITTVADALNDVTSAYVAQSGSQGGTTSLFLRGGESKYVKVLIDGVPVNDPGGVYDFASLTTDNVDRIEIVRGPVSVVHGADAVTGVVHIITSRGSGPQRSESEVRVGAAPRTPLGSTNPASATTWIASTRISGSMPSAAYSVGVAAHANDGLYETNNRYRNSVLSGSAAFFPQEGTTVRLALRYNAYQFNYPTNSAGDVTDVNAYRTEDRTAIGVELERAVSSKLLSIARFNSSVNDGGTDDQQDAPGGDSYVSQDKTRRRSAEWRLQFQPARRVITNVGVQVERQDQRSQSQSQSSFGPFYDLFRASRANTGAYADVLVTTSERVTITAGARIDDNERFGNFTTARGGVSWWLTGSTRFRATAGNAFREPSFFENYATGFVAGNPDLVPEQTRAFDGGIDQDLLNGRARLSVTGFAQRFRNMIDYSGSNACGFSYCNIAAAEANGVEVEIGGLLVGPVSGTVGGTVLRTNVITPGFDASAGGLYHTGEALIRRPEHKWTGELTYRGRGPVSAALRVLAVGKRPDRDFHFPAAPVTLPAYQRVDLSAEDALPGGRRALTLRIENLFDAKYQNIFNFLAPRRTVTLGVRTAF